MKCNVYKHFTSNIFSLIVCYHYLYGNTIYTTSDLGLYFFIHTMWKRRGKMVSLVLPVLISWSLYLTGANSTQLCNSISTYSCQSFQRKP
jgi:hypothetical protein